MKTTIKKITIGAMLLTSMVLHGNSKLLTNDISTAEVTQYYCTNVNYVTFLQNHITYSTDMYLTNTWTYTDVTINPDFDKKIFLGSKVYRIASVTNIVSVTNITREIVEVNK
jgi:hypothetical protein